MFDGLTNKLSDVFKMLGSRGIITEKDIGLNKLYKICPSQHCYNVWEKAI